MFNRTQVRSFLFQIILKTATVPNKPVYAIAAPYRENLLAKDDRWVDSGSARPGYRRAPLLVSWFLQQLLDASDSEEKYSDV